MCVRSVLYKDVYLPNKGEEGFEAKRRVAFCINTFFDKKVVWFCK